MRSSSDFWSGGATLALGQIAFATTRTPLIRAVIGLLYAVPATVAGYQVSFALAGIGMSTGGWQTAFAVVGAVLSGFTAFSRMTLFVPPSDGQGTRGAQLTRRLTGGRTTRDADALCVLIVEQVGEDGR